MPRKSKNAAKNFEANPHDLECEDLEPIRTVVRELTRPDGTTLRVEVPVYPPFRLKEKKNPAPEKKQKR